MARHYINGNECDERRAYAHFMREYMSAGGDEDNALHIWFARLTSEEARDTIADVTHGAVEIIMQWSLLPPESEQQSLFD